MTRVPPTGTGTGSVTVTKGGAPVSTSSVTTIAQVAFDPRIQNYLTAPFDSGPVTLYRGFIQWDTVSMGSGVTTNGPNPTIRFLFNPSTVSASYQMSSATATAALIFPNPNQAQLRVPLQQQVGFTIMFDRTYEMNYGTGGAFIKNLGVEADIRMMKQLTGMYNTLYSGNNPYYQTNPLNPNAPAPTAYTDAAGNTANPNGTGVQQGVMQFTFCYLYFSYPNTGLNYYGYIDSWDVQYTHFNEKMIPMRAVVDISFSLLPPPGTTGGAGGSGSGTIGTSAVSIANSTAGTPTVTG